MKKFHSGMPLDDWNEIMASMKPCKKNAIAYAVRVDEPFMVVTLEGTMAGKAGDYLMRGVNGELYPCDADIFAKTYEWVE